MVRFVINNVPSCFGLCSSSTFLHKTLKNYAFLTWINAMLQVKNHTPLKVKTPSADHDPETANNSQLLSAVRHTHFNPEKVYIITGGLGGLGKCIP